MRRFVPTCPPLPSPSGPAGPVPFDPRLAIVATRIDILDETDSTQDVARRHIGPDPVLVVTHRQVRGRGRGGSGWQPAPRAVAASLAFEPGWPSEALARLTLVAGLAASDVVDVRLKWPNDLLVGADKVGGLLLESSDGRVVAGCGINLWWPDAPSGMGAIHEDDPGPDVVVAIASAWAERLLDRASAGPGAWGRDEYVARCGTLGRPITWEPAGSGRAVDVAADGGLVVETDEGVVTLRSGEVREIRPA